MKYYCPKKWYRNVEMVKPVADKVIVAIVLRIHAEPRSIKKWMHSSVLSTCRSWEWSELGGASILYFRVKTRTPQLVENPSVQLHEMLEPRNG